MRGSASWAMPGRDRLTPSPRSALRAAPFRRMPREVPLTSSITPLRARACRCSSAALADLKPSSAAISARVGGAPVRAMARCTSCRICCCRGVSRGVSLMVGLARKLYCYPVTVFLISFQAEARGGREKFAENPRVGTGAPGRSRATRRARGQRSGSGGRRRLAGNSAENSDPRPGALSISSRAPWRSSTCLTMARPRPVPPVSRERLRSMR